MATRELTDDEVFGVPKELSDADVFGPLALPPTVAPGPRQPVGRGFSRATPLGPVLERLDQMPPDPLLRPAGSLAVAAPQTGNPTIDAAGLLLDSRSPISTTIARQRGRMEAEAQKRAFEARVREDTDAAFGTNPIVQAIVAPGRRLAAGMAQAVGGVASIPRQLGFDVGKETMDSADLMSKANLPEDPGLADQVLAGAGQVGPMVKGAMVVRSLLAPVIGDAAAVSTATALTGGAGGAMTGGQILQDLEDRQDITDAEKRGRALLGSVASAITGKYADRLMLPGTEAALAGRPIAAGVRAAAGEGAQEWLDQVTQNALTDKPLGEGAGTAAIVGAATGGGARAVTEVNSPAAQLAHAIDQDANVFADRPAPVVVQQPVARIEAKPEPAAARNAPARQEMSDAEVGLLPHDPNVAPGESAPMIATAEGVVRQMSGDEQRQAEAARLQGEDTGLTPDVRRAQDNRSEPQDEPLRPSSDLVRRLMDAGWTPPETNADGSAGDIGARPAEAAPDFNPAPDAEEIDGIARELELLYQEQVKENIRQRLGLSRPETEARQRSNSDFLNFLREHGVSAQAAQDIYGNNAFRANKALPGVFRPKGLNLDELVHRAVERGFLTQGDVESALDTGGVRKLTELIQQQIRGKTPVSMHSAEPSGLSDYQVSAGVRRIDRGRQGAASPSAPRDARQESAAERLVAGQEALVDQGDMDSPPDAATVHSDSDSDSDPVGRNVKAGEAAREHGGQIGHAQPSRRPDTESRSTAEAMHGELRDRFGVLTDRLEQRGFLKLWDSVEDYNRDAGQSSRIEGAAAGYYSHKTKTAHLFAEHIEPGKAVGVFLHEVGEHASMRDMLGPQRYKDLVRRAYQLADQGDEAASTALLRIPEDTPGRYYDSEMLAYLIEEAANAKAPSAGLKKWLADVLSALRAWFYQTDFGRNLERFGVRLELSAKDIVALAERAVSWQAEQSAQQDGEASGLSPAAQHSAVMDLRTVQVDGARRPIENSSGKLVAGGFKEQQNFWRWFGDSKAVDGRGRPVVMYHGTRADFDTYGGRNFFAANPEYASAFAGMPGGRGAPNVMPVYLAVRNPLDVRELGLRNLSSTEVRQFLEDKGIEAPSLGGPDGPWWEHFLHNDDKMIAAMRAAGYDGLVQHEDIGDGSDLKTDAWVIFDPKQVKSATGNAGTFDAEDADIRYSRPTRNAAQAAANVFGPHPPGTNTVNTATQPWTVPEPGTWDNFVRQIQNNKIDLKRVKDAVEEQFGRLPESADPYLSEELYHGKVSARIEQLHKDSVEPMLRKIAVAGKQHGVTIADVNLYLHARHAPERNAAMKAINPTMANNDALSGMSDQEAAKVMADFRAGGKEPALAVIAKDVDQLLSDTRTNLVADGLEEAATIQAWEQAYKHYVPLQRDLEGGTPKGQGFSVRGPEGKRAVGSNRDVVNILANVVTQAETAAIRAEKAEVGRTLLEMAEQYPNPDFWKVDKPPVKPRVDPNTGLVIRTAVDPHFQTADNVVMVKDYGRERYVVFNRDNPRAAQVAKAMKNLDVAQLPKVVQWVGKATRFMASLLTARNPEFWLTNFARDLQGSMIQMGGTDAEGMRAQTLENLPKALAGMRNLVRGGGNSQWARYAKELQDAGGTTGYLKPFDNSDARMKDLRREVARMQQGVADPRKLVRTMVDFIDDYNDVIENGMRLAVFQAARDAGVSTARAASVAKNITVNFNRKGNATPLVNSLYMFFNAGVQGTARIMQALATSNSARVAVSGLVLAAFVMDAVNRAMSGDDDETKRNRYDLISEFEKSRNWIFMVPGRPGEYVKVPLPIGFNVFHNAGRLLSDAMFRKDPRNASEYGWAFASTMLDAFSPLGNFGSVGQLIAPTIADPVVQLAENKTFTGSPVYKSSDKGFGKTDPKPAYTRHFESTPDLWVAASKRLNDMTGGDKVKPGAVNVEPDILRHIYGTLTGGPGKALDRTLDTAQAEARGEKVTAARIPLVSRFYGSNDDRQRDAAYYADLKRAQVAKAQYDYFVKNGRRDLALQVLTDLGKGDVARGRQVIAEFERANKDDRTINAKLRQLDLQKQDSDESTASQTQAQILKERRGDRRYKALAHTATED